MSDGYIFHCSKCKVDHAGECPPTSDSFYGIERSVDTTRGKLFDALQKSDNDIVKQIQSLVDALSAGDYNAKPTTLHQCSQNPPCICFQPDPGPPDDADDEEDLACPCGCEDADDDLDAATFHVPNITDVKLTDNKDGTGTWSYQLKLPTPLRFLQFSYQLPLKPYFLDSV